jgi:hypothetical protein
VRRPRDCNKVRMHTNGDHGGAIEECHKEDGARPNHTRDAA